MSDDPMQGTAADVGPCDWLASDEQVLWAQPGRHGKIQITTKSYRGVVSVRDHDPAEPMPVRAKALTVAALRRALAGLDDDVVVLLSSDPEGNSYGAAAGVGAVSGPVVRGYSPGSPDIVRSPSFGWPVLLMYPLPSV